MKKVSQTIFLAFSVLLLFSLVQTSCTTNFNPSIEMKGIETIISNGEVDSVAGHDEEGVNYKYYIKQNEIIKLTILVGGEEYACKNEYYFKGKGNVFAYKINKWSPADAIDYRATICFQDSSIVSEEYWLRDDKVSKPDMQKSLAKSGHSIEEEILIDYESKRIIGALNIKDFAQRFNFKIPGKEDTKNQASDIHPDNESMQNHGVKVNVYVVV